MVLGGDKRDQARNRNKKEESIPLSAARAGRPSKMDEEQSDGEGWCLTFECCVGLPLMGFLAALHNNNSNNGSKSISDQSHSVCRLLR